MLSELTEIITTRYQERPVGSYTTSLFEKGEDEILKKIGEESFEVLLAAKSQGDERLIEETADLIYHLMVLLASRELTLQDVEEELRRRHLAAQ